MDHDPERPRPEFYGKNARPQGDDGGWHDPHKTGLYVLTDLHILRLLSSCFVDIVAVNDLGNKEKTDEHADCFDAIESRRPFSTR